MMQITAADRLQRQEGWNRAKQVNQPASADIEVKEFQELVDLVNQVPTLKKDLETDIAQKQALAFLVNELKKTEPQSWQESLKTLKDKIKTEIDFHKESPDGAQVEVSWLLAQEISNLYQLALFAKINDAMEKNEPRKATYFHAGLSIAQYTNKINSFLHSKSSRVSIGGITQDFIPDWSEHV